MSLVGKTFPDMSVKAIDEMGDAFQINVLKQAVDNKRKYACFGTRKISRLFVQLKFMLFRRQLKNLRKEIQF